MGHLDLSKDFAVQVGGMWHLDRRRKSRDAAAVAELASESELK
jgi:hypothetical protein